MDVFLFHVLTAAAGFGMGFAFLWVLLDEEERARYSYWYVRRKAERFGEAKGSHGPPPKLMILNLPAETGGPSRDYLVSHNGAVYMFRDVDEKTIVAYVSAIVYHDPNE